jgi:hypothetical protein
MKYLLGIGFVITQKYKKDPIARIFIDDTFIDELSLVDCPNCKKLWQRDTNIWIYQREYTNYFSKQYVPGYRLFDEQSNDHFPKKWKLYVIDETQLKHKKQLRIQISNSDSNYTNGFMTKTTLLDFFTFLIPLKFIQFFTKDGEAVRKEFNQAIVDEEYAYSNFPLNLASVNEKNRQEIGYMMLNKMLTKMPSKLDPIKWAYGSSPVQPTYMRRAEGYPFALNTFWNGNIVETHDIGGSGDLTVDLLTRESNVVTFDNCDAENIEQQKQGKIDQACGFHISEKFFSMAHNNMFDKYLHNENQ